MKKTFLFFAIAAFAIQVNAQTHFSLHLGGAFPSGDYGAYNKVEKLSIIDPKGKDGSASMGINLGMKAKFDIASVNGLGVIATGDIFFNGINSDFSDDYAKYFEDNGLGTADDWEITTPKYLNVPIMVGANYTYNVNSNIGLFGEAAVGVNFRKITNLSATYTDPSNDEVVIKNTFDISTSFAFQIGAGLIFNENVSLGIHYYSLGSSKVKGKQTIEYPSSWGMTDENDKIKVGKLTTGMLALRLGFHF